MSDLALQSAVVVGKNLLQKIKDIDDRYEEDSPDWEKSILEALRFCVAAEEGITAAKVAVLAIIERHWDDLSLSFRIEYNNQFSVLVMRETGLMPSTMDNYIRAANTFILEGKKPFGQIKVPVRDDYGKVVMDAGEPAMQYVEFDPTQISMTKLSLMRSAVEKDQMTPKRWSMLMDRGTSPEELKQELYKVDEPSVPAGMKFHFDGDVLVVTEPGYEAIELGEFFFEMWEQDLGRRALKRIFGLLGIPYDEDILAQRYEEKKNRYLARIYEELNGESPTTEQHNAT